MPVAYVGFHLKPVGFFDGNPALDMPRSTPACHTGNGHGHEHGDGDGHGHGAAGQAAARHDAGHDGSGQATQ
jgi:primary-amine oxidase